MKFTAAATACLVSCAIANPIGETIILARNAPFTDPSCALSQSVSGTPLTFLFPSAVEIGTILGPLLKAQIGEDNVEKLDNIADALCVYVYAHPHNLPITRPEYRMIVMLT